MAEIPYKKQLWVEALYSSSGKHVAALMSSGQQISYTMGRIHLVDYTSIFLIP